MTSLSGGTTPSTLLSALVAVGSAFVVFRLLLVAVGGDPIGS